MRGCIVISLLCVNDMARSSLLKISLNPNLDNMYTHYCNVSPQKLEDNINKLHEIQYSPRTRTSHAYSVKESISE